MDVVGAYTRRLPALDERWQPRAHDRAALADALLVGGVAGTATHPLDNVRGNILMLIEGDPDKAFGLSGLPGTYDFDDIVAIVEAGAGAPIDHDERFGPVDIRPEPVLDGCDAWGERLHLATQRNETVVLATGHPIGLGLFYHRLDGWLREHGARVEAPAHGVHWREAPMPHDWFIDHWGGVGMLTDGREPRHTHWPDAMHRMLAELTPDLVLADHGFAGAAIEAGIETLSIADVNDPALLVAQAQGRTEHVLVMDDHVDPAAYWPCFQAIAARWDSA